MTPAETRELAAYTGRALRARFAVILHTLTYPGGRFVAPQITRYSCREISDGLELGARVVEAFEATS